MRREHSVNFQLWYSDDLDHRLDPKKLVDIITLSEDKLGLSDTEVEVEYQSDTIGKYGLDFDGTSFLLTAKQTDCLAKEGCGIPAAQSFELDSLIANPNSCAPGGNCC